MTSVNDIESTIEMFQSQVDVVDFIPSITISESRAMVQEVGLTLN